MLNKFLVTVLILGLSSLAQAQWSTIFKTQYPIYTQSEEYKLGLPVCVQHITDRGLEFTKVFNVRTGNGTEFNL